MKNNVKELIGRSVKNDNFELRTLLGDFCSVSDFKHIGNYVFRAELTDGNVLLIDTAPSSDNCISIVGIRKAITDETCIYTHDDACQIIELFEDLLDRYDITVPSPEDDERDIENNGARLYGSTYSELLDSIEDMLLDLLRRHNSETKVIPDVFSGTI